MGAQPFEIHPDLWLIDTGLYHVARRTLVLCDLHLGYEDMMRRQGVLLPETRLADLFQRLDEAFEALDVSPQAPLQQLILNGDLRHDFGPLTQGEWKELNAFFERLTAYSTTILILEGNHDPVMAGFAARFANVRSATQHQEEGWLYLHGDRVPPLPEDAAHLVIGHEHPAISLVDPVTGRRERYKAFLHGRFAGRSLWVLPSCNTLIQGTDLVREGTLSPFLAEGGWQRCEAFVRDDGGRIYAFGPLNRLI